MFDLIEFLEQLRSGLVLMFSGTRDILHGRKPPQLLQYYVVQNSN